MPVIDNPFESTAETAVKLNEVLEELSKKEPLEGKKEKVAVIIPTEIKAEQPAVPEGLVEKTVKETNFSDIPLSSTFWKHLEAKRQK